MARIVIANWGKKTLEVTDLRKSLLRHFQDHYLDWMHACGGKGRCTTCKTVVVEGMSNLGPVTPAEQMYRVRRELGPDERLACQATVKGDVVVNVPEQNKLAHVNYLKP